MSELTHSQCINLAAVWLSNQKPHREHNPDLSYSYRCQIILTEMTGSYLTDEIPDVLGIWSSEKSVNIECKVSRADFLKDAKKKHKHPFGNYKFYACPTGLIKPEEIPEHFGLIYVAGNGGKIIKHAKYLTNAEKRKEPGFDETSMLCNLILNARMSCDLTSIHKKRDRQWDGKAVIL